MAEKRVLVVAAHPDDEVLGCGGTLALHARAGDYVVAVIACEGESLRYGPEGVGQRENTLEATHKLGIKDVKLLGFPDQQLDRLTLTEVITPLEKIIRELRPNIIYCHHGNDLNRDHQLLIQALLVASRPTEQYIEAIYAFDTASSTEWAFPRTFVPDTWVDISATVQMKLEAMACYRSEVREYPHPRSLEGLSNRAKAWGNQCCLSAAEVFMTVRRVMRNGQTPV
jgi:LmbE family N-acetylglucosaminyl deacetylase